MSTQHFLQIGKEASFSVAVFTENDIYSCGSRIQDIMVGHFTWRKRNEQLLNYQTWDLCTLNHRSRKARVCILNERNAPLLLSTETTGS